MLHDGARFMKFQQILSSLSAGSSRSSNARDAGENRFGDESERNSFGVGAGSKDAVCIVRCLTHTLSFQLPFAASHGNL